MLHTGIDYHKKYSVVSMPDATGTREREARIDENEPAAFVAYFESPPSHKATAGDFLSDSERKVVEVAGVEIELNGSRKRLQNS